MSPVDVDDAHMVAPDTEAAVVLPATPDTEAAPVFSAPLLGDRRRPGRPAHVSPELVALLREQTQSDAPQRNRAQEETFRTQEETFVRENRVAMLGVVAAAAIGVITWVALYRLGVHLLTLVLALV